MEALETGHSLIGELEIREGGRKLSGRFPYGGMAVISDRLTTRKETFAQNAFDYALEEAQAKRGALTYWTGITLIDLWQTRLMKV